MRLVADAVTVQPDDSVYDRIDPYWIDFEVILVADQAETAAGVGSATTVHGAIMKGSRTSTTRAKEIDREFVNR